ncbi:MAG TPA: SdiA-regulated domain-containing protein [Gemmatimonadales bacterium]|nr:SdiA-regulated domain-containing protein [Gemmatimonadales bacterium]
MPPGPRYTSFVVLLLAAACDPDRGAQLERTAAEREAAFAERTTEVRAAGVADRPVARWELPGALSEVSGLAIAPDGRLFAHGDETGDLFEIDYRSGIVVKRFSLGPDDVTADFEALAIRGSTFWLLTSRGRLYEFEEGRNGERVPYRTAEPPVGEDCEEFEGMTVDGDALVIACKKARKAFGGALHLYRWPVGSRSAERIEVPADSIRARMPEWEEFSASGITRRDDTGTFILVAGPEQGYLEVSAEGRIIVARALPADHGQPEGVAWTSDGMLFIADEATGRTAAVTIYPEPLR